MTAKRQRPTTRTPIPRTGPDRARRRQLADAASGWLGYAGPLTAPTPLEEVRRDGDR